MNLKRKGTLRDCIYAPHGKVLLVFDLSQIECRFALWFGMLSRSTTGMERASLDMMAEGDRLRSIGEDDSASDLYSYFATMMYGRPILKGRDAVERQGGKSAVLGLGFGMGPGRFIDYNLTLGNRIDAAFSESTVYLYRNTYKGVKSMWRTFESAMKAGLKGDYWKLGPIQVTRDPMFNSLSFQLGDNLLLKYPDLAWDAEGSATYRDGNHFVNIFGGKWMENICQHAARNVLTERMMEIQQRYEVVMTTYDEVVLLVDADKVDEAIAFGNSVMTRPHPMFPGLPLGCEFGYAQRYGQAKS
jgi:DNA polymerase